MNNIYLVGELNGVLEDYKKDKNANPKAYIVFFIKGTDDFYQQSTYLKDIFMFDHIKGSDNYIRIVYKDKQVSFKNIDQVFEFFFCIDPKDDDDKPIARKSDSYTG